MSGSAAWRCVACLLASVLAVPAAAGTVKAAGADREELKEGTDDAVVYQAKPRASQATAVDQD
jgi:hypothetical protein